jgi:hypothetical protein
MANRVPETLAPLSCGEGPGERRLAVTAVSFAAIPVHVNNGKATPFKQ